MKKLICLTCGLFTSSSYSINYHLVVLLKSIYMENVFEITVCSYEDNPDLAEPEVLDNLGGAELAGRVRFMALDSMAPGAWLPVLGGADMVLCQHYSFAGILKAVKRHCPRIRIVSWIHSIVLEEYLSGPGGNKNEFSPFIRMQQEQVKLSDICIFDSRYDYERGCLDFTGLKRTEIIYPVTETVQPAEEIVCPAAEILPEAAGKDFCSCAGEARDAEILFIGRWDYRKGLDSLIPCSFRLFMECGIRTVVLSDGSVDSIFSDDVLRRQYGILLKSGGIRFEEWKPARRDFIRFLLGKRRVAVLPSYYDPFNMTAYDCAALGLPLVVSNRCGVCELLTPGPDICFCNPYDIEGLYEQMKAMCGKEMRMDAGMPPAARADKGGMQEFRRKVRNVFLD